MEFLISFYDSVKSKKPSKTITFEDFITDVQFNEDWRRKSEKVKNAKNKSEKKKLKSLLPGVRISGTFSGQTDDSIITSSGLICLDIDEIGDPEELKAKIVNDRYTAAAFLSVSGQGLCVVFRIKPGIDFADAYISTSAYIYDNYGVECDPACKNISRFRFITSDSNPYLNLNCQIFDKIQKPKKQQKIEFSPLFLDDDIDHIVSQIQETGIDITADYADWTRIGLALAGHYGESGRNYFHIISQNNPNYNQRQSDKKYDSYLRSGGKKLTIRTLFYLAKNAGINITSPKRSIVEAQAFNIAKSNPSPAALKDTLKLQGIEIDDDTATNAIEAAKNAKPASISPILLIKNYISERFDLYRNTITKKIYCRKQEPHMYIDEVVINSIYVCIKEFSTKATKQDVLAVINSDFVPDYHPFEDFLNSNSIYNGPDLIRELIDTLIIAEDVRYPEYKHIYIRKWLLGIVAGMHGVHNELMPILAGGRGIGKTVWLRNLLPEKLRYLAGTASMEKDRDGKMLLNNFLLLIDDEFAGKTTRDFRVLKNILSMDSMPMRLPYAATVQNLPRIASWCATTNENELIDDPTGNRRLIPMTVIKIDQKKYSEIDRDMLWNQLVAEYIALDNDEYRKPHHLNAEEMEFLNKVSSTYAVSTSEGDLIGELFDLPTLGRTTVDLTAAEIMALLKAKYRAEGVTPNKVGRMMQAMGFKKKSKRYGNVVAGVYTVCMRYNNDLAYIGKDLGMEALNSSILGLNENDLLDLPN